MLGNILLCIDMLIRAAFTKCQHVSLLCCYKSGTLQLSDIYIKYINEKLPIQLNMNNNMFYSKFTNSLLLNGPIIIPSAGKECFFVI